MLQKVRDIIASLKKRSAENRDRVHYELPRSTFWFLLTIFMCWPSPSSVELFLFALNIAFAICAVVHDYKEDGELTGTSIFFIVLDLILIGFVCFLFFR